MNSFTTAAAHYSLNSCTLLCLCLYMDYNVLMEQLSLCSYRHRVHALISWLFWNAHVCQSRAAAATR